MKEHPLPHILLLITDQFRYDAFSVSITPNLYSLLTRNDTTFFDNAYSSTPTCTPARVALLTGKSPWTHGMLSYSTYTNCDRYPTTLPMVLAEHRNYATAAIGKNHFGPIKHVQGYQDEILYEGVDEIQDDCDDGLQSLIQNHSQMRRVTWVGILGWRVLTSTRSMHIPRHGQPEPH